MRRGKAPVCPHFGWEEKQEAQTYVHTSLFFWASHIFTTTAVTSVSQKSKYWHFLSFLLVFFLFSSTSMNILNGAPCCAFSIGSSLRGGKMNRVSYQLSLTLKLFLLSQGTPAVLHCSFAPCPRQERLLAGRLSVYRCISMSDAEPRLHQRVPMLSSAVDSCFNELTLVAPGYGDSLSFCPFPHEACISHLLYHFIKHI